MVRLRGHHLLCLLTYAGHGYSPAFTANFDRLAGLIAAGRPVEIVDGPDDVCAPWCDDREAHCALDRLAGRDLAALDAVGRHLGRPLRPGDCLTLDAATIAELRAAFRSGALRSACAGCRWRDVCTTIAEAGFSGTRIPPGRGFSAPRGR